MSSPRERSPVPSIPLGAPFLREIGLDAAEPIPGGVRLRLAHRVDNANRNGTLHGGVIASLVEAAGALALERVDAAGRDPSTGPGARTTGARTAGAPGDVASEPDSRAPWHRPPAVDLSIHFVAPAVDRAVVAEAQVVRRGRSVGFAAISIADDGGSPIARGMLAARAATGLPRGDDDPVVRDALPARHLRALERLSSSRFSGSAFSARLQVRSARIPGEGVVALLPWQELLADEAGQVHAGAIATAVDAAGGASAWTAGGFDPRGRASTIAMHLTVAHAPAGADLVAIAQPPWRTGELFSIAVEVATRDRAEPVAWGSVVYRVVRPE